MSNNHPLFVFDSRLRVNFEDELLETSVILQSFPSKEIAKCFQLFFGSRLVVLFVLNLVT